MLEHHVSHLPIAASAELEGVIDEAEPVVLGVVPVRVDPNAQTFALIESTGEVDRVGAYVGRYLAGGQLEQFLKAPDRSWKPLWVSPSLLKQSGWSLERCQWVRQGWHVQRGTWRGSSGPFGGLTTRRPSWWFRPEDKEWVLTIVGEGEERQAA
jgi:hypothetical protein